MPWGREREGETEVALTRHMTPEGSADDGKRLARYERAGRSWAGRLFCFLIRRGSGGGNGSDRVRPAVDGFMLEAIFSSSWLQDVFRCPKTAQDAPKTPPRRPKRPPGGPQEAPGVGKWRENGGKTEPSWHQNGVQLRLSSKSEKLKNNLAR